MTIETSYTHFISQQDRRHLATQPAASHNSKVLVLGRFQAQKLFTQPKE